MEGRPLRDSPNKFEAEIRRGSIGQQSEVYAHGHKSELTLEILETGGISHPLRLNRERGQKGRTEVREGESSSLGHDRHSY